MDRKAEKRESEINWERLSGLLRTWKGSSL